MILGSNLKFIIIYDFIHVFGQYRSSIFWSDEPNDPIQTDLDRTIDQIVFIRAMPIYYLYKASSMNILASYRTH